MPVPRTPQATACRETPRCAIASEHDSIQLLRACLSSPFENLPGGSKLLLEFANVDVLEGDVLVDRLGGGDRGRLAQHHEHRFHPDRTVRLSWSCSIQPMGPRPAAGGLCRMPKASSMTSSSPTPSPKPISGSWSNSSRAPAFPTVILNSSTKPAISIFTAQPWTGWSFPTPRSASREWPRLTVKESTATSRPPASTRDGCGDARTSPGGRTIDRYRRLAPHAPGPPGRRSSSSGRPSSVSRPRLRGGAGIETAAKVGRHGRL